MATSLLMTSSEQIFFLGNKEENYNSRKEIGKSHFSMKCERNNFQRNILYNVKMYFKMWKCKEISFFGKRDDFPGRSLLLIESLEFILSADEKLLW